MTVMDVCMQNVKILDVGTGTEIKRRGYKVPSHIESIWSAQALIDNPDIYVLVKKLGYDIKGIKKKFILYFKIDIIRL